MTMSPSSRPELEQGLLPAVQAGLRAECRHAPLQVHRQRPRGQDHEGAHTRDQAPAALPATAHARSRPSLAAPQEADKFGAQLKSYRKHILSYHSTTASARCPAGLRESSADTACIWARLRLQQTCSCTRPPALLALSQPGRPQACCTPRRRRWQATCRWCTTWTTPRARWHPGPGRGVPAHTRQACTLHWRPAAGAPPQAAHRSSIAGLQWEAPDARRTHRSGGAHTRAGAWLESHTSQAGLQHWPHAASSALHALTRCAAARAPQPAQQRGELAPAHLLRQRVHLPRERACDVSGDRQVWLRAACSRARWPRIFKLERS